MVSASDSVGFSDFCSVVSLCDSDYGSDSDSSVANENEKKLPQFSMQRKFCTLCVIVCYKSKFSQLFCFRRFFSAEPHIAGSPRQKVLAEELVRRWKDEYGFDKVEMPMYEALLSKPDMDKKTRVTLKYKNGTIIYQVKGEEQV